MSIFSVGLSGLNAAQSALNTTSNNISNVYTPGYNRELTILGEGRGDGGVRVNDIQRQFNHYVANQLNAATSSSSALAAYQGQISQIDNLLADRDAGLAPLMQNFFSSLEDLASAPSDPAARQGVLGTAQTLAAQFQSFDSYLQDMQEGINGQISDEVTQINNTTEQLATLNREIALARARSGEAPNGLLNQRDQLVAELSERMDVRVVIQDGKTYNISLPNGQPLVSGTNHYKLEAMKSPNDPERTVLGYRDSGQNLVALAEDTIKGGTLGGLMTFRSESLDKTQNQIGQLAVSLAVGFNEQHRQGVDLDGELGEDFFTLGPLGQPQAYSASRNTGTAEIASKSFDTANIDQLRATDYTVRFTGGEPQVIRKDNGQALTAETVYAELGSDEFHWDAANSMLSFGGVTLEFSGTPANGDRFEVQPVRRGAANFEAKIADLDKIAAGDAGFVDGTGSALNSFKSTGDLAVDGLSVTPVAFANNKEYQFEVDSDGTLTVTPAATIRVDGGDSVDPSDVELEGGEVITIDGISFTLGELPEEEDATATLTVTQNIIAATGDNRNALALQNLQSEALVGGRASFSQAYAGMISDVGNQTNIVQVNLDARQGLTDQLRAVQQSESGVNLDEEAANLLRYQQFYAANARVIDTASTIFDTILGLRS